MKILRLKALNINSLQGVTEIDFIDFLNGNALFAITGETGSGKSTLLDIISCALYGRTAKLKNPEELMSRGTGEAICEVEFEVKGKTYRSSWTLRRARGKPDGAFQNSKMELSDALTGTIIESKKSLVPKNIEGLTGLDFGRFTQSMMLAQGSFDAFLKAPENKRSELLEQITGTKIYSEISKLAYQKYVENKQELEREESVLEGIQLIEPEIIKEKKEQLSKSQDEKIKIDKKLQTATKVLEWKKTHVTLTAEYAKSQKELTEATQKNEENKENYAKLNAAHKALEISALYTKKIESEVATENKKQALARLSDDIDALDKELLVLNREITSSQQAYILEKENFESESIKIQKAREFQTQMQEKAKSIAKLNDEITDQEVLKKKLVTDLDKVTEEDTKLTKQIGIFKNYIDKNSVDAGLIKNISLIEQLRQTLKDNDLAYNAILDDTQIKVKLIDAKARDIDTLKKETAILEKLVVRCKGEYKNIEAEVASLEEQEPKLIEKRSSLQELERLLLDYRNTLKVLRNEMEAMELNALKIKSLNEKTEPLDKQINELKEHIETLKEKKEQELLIKKYEEDRKKLVLGEPCFLCGSTEHPLAEGSYEVSESQTGVMLIEKELSLGAEERNLNSIKQESAVTSERLRSNELEIEKLKSQTEKYEKLLGQNNISLIDESEAEIRDKLSEIETMIRTVSIQRSNKNTLLKKRDDAVSNFNEKEDLLRKANEGINILKAELTNLNKDKTNTEGKRQEQISLLSEHWKTYGLHFNIDTHETEFQMLLQRKQDFEDTQKKWKETEELCQTNSVSKKEIETKLAAVTDKLLEDTKKYSGENEDHEALKKKRFSLIKVENIDLHEIEVKKVLEEKQLHFNQTEKKLSERSSTLEEKNKQHSQMKLDYQQLITVTKGLKEQFGVQLKEKGFESEERFHLAHLSQESRDELSTLCDNIKQAFRDAKIREEETGKRFKKHNEVVLTEEEVFVLEAEQEKCQEQLEEIQRSIGSTTQELDIDTRNKNMAKEKIDSISKRKEEQEVWIKMYELIGSADGAKFSKFAQGITLDQLIFLANNHLNMLTDRYDIVRRKEEKNLLELDIVDRYQGNEVRPVNTLSGGESFLVSLALALGLSELASQKISIDSLFLDEGFGTLDSDSLETALEALNLLESKGKMVGVISHVEALKEWIPLQIKVNKNGGGISSIEMIG